jgi:iron complex outermembrane receptor protein
MSRPYSGRARFARAFAFSISANATLFSVAAATEADQKIEEIVVTASPVASNPDDLATHVGQVGRDDILRLGGSTLSDALATVPGVTGSSFAAGASRPIIRGFDANRVRILENGIGSFDVSDVGPDHGVPIDPLSTQKIEVVRGAATLRFGSQAIGGVVNAINTRVPIDLEDQGTSGEVLGSLGTGANLREAAAMIDNRSGNLAVHADGFIRRTGDYDIPDGEQANSFFRGDGFSFGSGYIGNSAKAGAAIVHYDAKYGIPGEDNYIDMRQTKGMVRSSLDVGNSAVDTVNVDAGYADYKHSEKDQAGEAQSTFIDKEWDSRLEAILSPNNVLSAAAVGVQVQHRKFSGLGEGADYLLPTRTVSAAAFAFAEAPLSDIVKLQTGARTEYVDINGTPLTNVETSKDFTLLSGSLGVVVNPTDALTLGLTASSAARAPAQTELFARGPHEGSQTFELGNPDLKIERSNSLEATLRTKASGIELETSAWVARFDNFIYGRLTGRTCDDDGVCAVNGLGELRELVYEPHDAWFRGLEAKATVPVVQSSSGALKWDVLGDYVRATLTNNAGNVPRIAPYRIGSGLNWESNTFDTGVRVTYTGAQKKVGSGDTPTDGFTSLDAHIAWRPLSAVPGFEVQLVGRNLTDTEQRSAVALNKDDVVLPGRDVRLMVRTTF